MGRRLLKKGDKIRLKVRTCSGWKGFGTVTQDQVYKDDAILFSKDDQELGFGNERNSACSHEVALLRNQK